MKDYAPLLRRMAKDRKQMSTAKLELAGWLVLGLVIWGLVVLFSMLAV